MGTMNIALVTTWKVKCGIASYSENLAKALGKEDINVYVVRLPRFGEKHQSIFQNIVDRIPIDKVDLIHVQHEYGLFAGVNKLFFPALAKLEKPVVTTMHSVGNWEDDVMIADVSKAIVVHNEYCRARFNPPPPNVHIIPHGMTPLQTPLPPKDICKSKFGIKPEIPIVGYVGFISQYKGLECLIDAMTAVPNVGLLIGGGWFTEQETEYIVNLREKARMLLPSRCQWLGFIADNDLPMVYGAMDLVVYPSRFMTESGALLMAVSHGKAVIASDLPPVREKAEKGALMTFHDTADLSKKIKVLLANQELRMKFEENAANFTKQNSWANVAQKHVELYRGLQEKS